MTFSDEDKLKALAIVRVFETSKPFGDYAACVVLNDGAGVSYGINQFTHRSGSLASVVETYLKNGGLVGRQTLMAKLPVLRMRTSAPVGRLAADELFKKALRAAAVSREMRRAQQQIAFERYLNPAIDICNKHGFVLPLSLAVVYDSVTHGSWERISATVPIPKFHSPQSERTWITEYVRKRHFWLTNVPRLRTTNYRTKFFLDQIAIGNWDLRLPLTVHGSGLTQSMFTQISTEKAVEPNDVPTPDITTAHGPQIPAATSAQIPQAQPPASVEGVGETGSEGERGNGFLETAANAVGTTAEKFDRVDGVVTAVADRKDAAKSLWTTVCGILSQAVWAVFVFIAGLPREVWIVVAVIAAALMLAYLYRQIELGKIREQRKADK